MLTAIDRQLDRQMDRRIRGAPVMVPTDLLPRPQPKQFTTLYRPSKIPVNDAVIMSDHIDATHIGSNLNPYSQATHNPLYGETRTERFISLPLVRPGANEVMWTGLDPVHAYVPDMSSIYHQGYGDGSVAVGMPAPAEPLPYAPIHSSSGTANHQYGTTETSIALRDTEYSPINGFQTSLPIANAEVIGSPIVTRSILQAPVDAMSHGVPITSTHIETHLLSPDRPEYTVYGSGYQGTYTDTYIDPTNIVSRSIQQVPIQSDSHYMDPTSATGIYQFASRPINSVQVEQDSGINMTQVYQAPIEGREVHTVPIEGNGINYNTADVVSQPQADRPVVAVPFSEYGHQTLGTNVYDTSSLYATQRQVQSVPIQQDSYDTLRSQTTDMSQQALREVVFSTLTPTQPSYQQNYDAVGNVMTSQQADRQVEHVPLNGVMPTSLQQGYSQTYDFSQEALREIAFDTIASTRINISTQNAVDASEERLRDTQFNQTYVFGAPVLEASLAGVDNPKARLHNTNYVSIETPMIFPEGQGDPFPNISKNLRR